ncbi:MAG: YibE/F family protein [Defluviitaleaceae bacterium]|nr:YibE/F family protein [Defluviitaleaceae bacterium]MCL2262966.1 YibE/F family protein [Defluviitaleaceae bacterium]
MKKIITNRRLLIVLVGFLFCAINISASGFFCSAQNRLSIYRARVISVDNELLSLDPLVQGMYLGRQVVEVEVLEGIHAGSILQFENIITRFFNHLSREGMTILVNIISESVMGGADGETIIIHTEMFGHSREGFMFGFIGLFFLVLIAVGRKKGLYSAISLLFTISTVIFFMLPFILRGHSPVLIAVITALLTMVFSIFMISDISMKSFAAIGGTFAGVTAAGIISVVAGRLAHISGMQMDHAEEVIFRVGRTAWDETIIVHVPQLLSAGIIIAALGAVMDVGMSISSAVFEIKELTPNAKVKRLYQSGMNIGRDIMGTMTNTLILAFAGSSITALVVIALYRLPYIRFINLNMLAVEVIQGLSATIGLILTVPITAILAAVLAHKSK